MRTQITPGRLYAKLSSEFRQVCCANCVRCVLPIPVPVNARDGSNWHLGTLPHECEECEKAIREIVRRHQAEFHLLDPISGWLEAHARDLSRPHGRAH
jgi:hypothetical protein